MTETPDAGTELLATLNEAERDFVEHLLRVAPNFRYKLSRPAENYPEPKPGIESAVVAAKIMTASAKRWI